jgi:type I restriction enzyme S subunit
LTPTPTTWSATALARLFDSCGGATPDRSNDEFWDGTIPWVSPKDMKRSVIDDSEDHVTEKALAETRLPLIPAGRVLVVVRGMILAHSLPVAVNAVDVTINQDMKALQPQPGVSGGFLAWLLRGLADDLLVAVEEAGHGTRCLRMDLWKGVRVHIPALEIQRSIAAYLDRKTADIDAVIVAKERMLTLLHEKRQALISHAVTEGLNPEAPKKESHIKGLGRVPTHWQLIPLGYIVDMCGGGTPSKDNTAFWNGNIPWVSPKDMKVWEIRDSEDHVTEAAIQSSTIALIQPPAVLLVVRGMILSHTIPVALTTAPVTINQDMKALLPHRHCFAKYLAHLLRAVMPLLLAMTEESGHGTLCLRTELWKKLKLPLPPLSEQLEITDFIDLRVPQIDRLVALHREQIEKLREYRQTVISAAVTGKFDVRGG